MLRRLRAVFNLRLLMTLEAALMGLWFLQALRFLVGMLYSRTAGAAVVTALPSGSYDPATPGVVDPAIVSAEISLLGLMLGLPLLTLALGRARLLIPLTVLAMAAGRTLMLLELPGFTPVMAAGLTVGAGWLYIAFVIHNRARLLPLMMVFAIALDQLFRAAGDTLDPSWSSAYRDLQIGLAVVGVLLSASNLWRTPRRPSRTGHNDPDRGVMSLWGGIGLGALLFLQVSLLALPNAIAGRADADYTTFVPLVLAATLLPLVPGVRSRARQIIAPFDPSTRGWIWFILLGLALVIGTRVTRLPLSGLLPGLGSFQFGALILVFAQFGVTLLWWWFVRPQAQNERNFTGLWLVLSGLTFVLFVAGDLFTYEYAFVRNFAPPFEALNPVVPSLLRGFRGMGLALILIALFLATLPMIQTTRRIAWTGGKANESLGMLLLIAGLTTLGAFLARPPVVVGVVGADTLRIGTYNIHSGYNEFWDYDLEAIALTIQRSGAEVVMLQEVEAGRLTSFGVDQSLWLARRLGMDRRFYPTNEGLQGLAVLSRVPVTFDDGVRLSSIGQQTGLQRVEIRPDEDVIRLYNTWLGLLLAGDSLEAQEREQRQQLTEILAIMDTHLREDYNGDLGRTLLGGTFNNVPGSPLIETLSNTAFRDPFAGSNVDLTATLVRTGIRARVDYLWLWQDALRDIGTGVIDSAASDHRLAFVAVDITR